MMDNSHLFIDLKSIYDKIKPFAFKSNITTSVFEQRQAEYTNRKTTTDSHVTGVNPATTEEDHESSTPMDHVQ